MAATNALDDNHWLWAKFDELNARHFHGKLERPQKILRSNFAAWEAAAVNTIVDGVPCRLIWIESATIDSDAASASDSLLHEMIHYELAAAAGGDGDQVHGPRFIARADEIGRALGLPSCAMPGSPKETIQKIASAWPKIQRAASLLSNVT